MINALTTGCGLVLTAAGLCMVWSFMRSTRVAAASAPPHALAAEPLPVLSASELFVATGTEGLLATIQSKCGFSAEHFDRTVLPVLKAYAEFVQQLPADGPHYDAKAGGLLIHGLEMVDFALAFRRGQILPKGAAPEDIMRLEHRWTYAVMFAALTHDIDKRIAGLRVKLYRHGAAAGVPWAPLAGTIAECGATRYGVDFVGDDKHETTLDAKLPLFLYQRLIPAEALAWLSNDHALIGELMGVLAGEKDCGSGAIRQLVLRADAQFAKCNLSAGSRVPLDPSGRNTEVPETADNPVQGADQHNRDVPERVTEEYLDDFDVGDQGAAANPGGSSFQASTPKRQLLEPVDLASSPALQSVAQAIPSAPPEAALRFMTWLQTGLAQGTLRFNELGAMVHFVKEGMLLVSPRIFQQFASVADEESISTAATDVHDKKDLAMSIQRQLLKAGWHVRSDKGNSIVPYHVLHGGKPGASIFGVVIAQPDRFVYPIPPANPHLLSADSSIKA